MAISSTPAYNKKLPAFSTVNLKFRDIVCNSLNLLETLPAHQFVICRIRRYYTIVILLKTTYAMLAACHSRNCPTACQGLRISLEWFIFNIWLGKWRYDLRIILH